MRLKLRRLGSKSMVYNRKVYFVSLRHYRNGIIKIFLYKTSQAKSRKKVIYSQDFDL